MRCFLAVDFPSVIIDEVARVQRMLKKHSLFTGTYVAPAQAHVTLKFLGDVTPERVEAIRQRLRTISCPSFQATLEGLGVFTPQQPRVLWLGVSGAGFACLQGQIEQVLAGLAPAEARSFQAHATLARIKHVIDYDELCVHVAGLAVSPLSFAVPAFMLKESELTSQGPLYTTVETFSLS